VVKPLADKSTTRLAGRMAVEAISVSAILAHD